MLLLTRVTIKVKILIIMIPLCLIGLAASGYMAVEYEAADSRYSRFLTTENAAALELARAERFLVATIYAAYQSLAYKPEDPAGQAATKLYEDSKAALMIRVSGVKRLLPEHLGRVEKLSAQIETITTMTNKAVMFSSQGIDESAKRWLSKADAEVTVALADMIDFQRQLSQQISAKSEEIRANTIETIGIFIGRLVQRFRNRDSCCDPRMCQNHHRAASTPEGADGHASGWRNRA